MERLREQVGAFALIGLLLMAGGTAGCGERTYTRAPDVQASVGDIEMRDIKLAPPPEGVYEVSSAARLEFAVVNTGRAEEKLIGVTGPDFSDVVVDGAPSDGALSIAIRPGETIFSGDSGDRVLILTGINATLRTAKYLPITFTFAGAGDATVDAVVSSPLRLTLDRALRESEQGED
ncbi:hypothetical protein [Blastococcus sp. TF02-8]|uniref:hypothetical protein n=1 Tax=Blastococcus sp. TF02-8 TaxID=2250574 RepID=UPI0011BFE1CA|nr:hypothetical protein [Blastococcus sp. TF02-8]